LIYQMSTIADLVETNMLRKNRQKYFLLQKKIQNNLLLRVINYLKLNYAFRLSTADGGSTGGRSRGSTGSGGGAGSSGGSGTAGRGSAGSRSRAGSGGGTGSSGGGSTAGRGSATSSSGSRTSSSALHSGFLTATAATMVNFTSSHFIYIFHKKIFFNAKFLYFYKYFTKVIYKRRNYQILSVDGQYILSPFLMS
jgi:hypothetical protein